MILLFILLLAHYRPPLPADATPQQECEEVCKKQQCECVNRCGDNDNPCDVDCYNVKKACIKWCSEPAMAVN